MRMKTYCNNKKKKINNIENVKLFKDFLIFNSIWDKKTLNKIYNNLIDLDNTNKIPPFIEIFKYLINKSEFYAKFSPEEQTLLKHLEHLTNKECYKFLEENKLGQKLIDTYYSSYNIFSSELKTKFPSVQFHSLLINSFTSFKIIETL